MIVWPQPESLLLSLLLCCFVPSLALVGISLWVLFRAQRWITPNPQRAQRRYARMRARQPQTSTDILVRQIVRDQALKVGFVGALTSLGGLPLLPVGLTVDLYASARLHNETLQLIANAYGLSAAQGAPLSLGQALQLRSGISAQQLIITGGQQTAQFATTQLIKIIAGKASAKLIPGIGFVIGFIVNYAIATAIGRGAARWYKALAAQHNQFMQIEGRVNSG